MENKREKDGTGSVNDGSRIERSSINASNFFSDLSNDDAASTRNSIATSLAEVEGGEEIYIAFETKGKGARIIPGRVVEWNGK